MPASHFPSRAMPGAFPALANVSLTIPKTWIQPCPPPPSSADVFIRGMHEVRSILSNPLTGFSHHFFPSIWKKGEAGGLLLRFPPYHTFGSVSRRPQALFPINFSLIQSKLSTLGLCPAVPGMLRCPSRIIPVGCQGSRFFF